MPIGRRVKLYELEPTVPGAMAPRRPPAPRPPAPSQPPRPSPAKATSGRWKSRKEGRADNAEPQMLSTAGEGSWPKPIEISINNRGDLNEETFLGLQSHGFWRFLELYASNDECRNRIGSLPVVTFLSSTVNRLAEYLAENVLPVTALIPVECLLKAALDPHFVESEYAGHIMSTLVVLLFGFSDVQLHYLYHIFVETDADKIMFSEDGISPMEWLSQFMEIPELIQTASTVDQSGSPRAASSAKTASTVGVRGSGVPTYRTEQDRTKQELPVCHPSLIFEHCNKLYTAWKPPLHQDFAAQGKPKHWDKSYHATFRKDMYDILCLIPEGDWVSTYYKYDEAKDIFTSSTIQNMLGHMAVEMFQDGANFRCLWHLYAFLSVRPTKQASVW